MSDVLGFKNHATAMIVLGLENERELLERADEITLEAFERGERGDDEAPRVTLADELRELIEDQPEIVAICGPDAEGGYAADLLGSALDAAEWLEIADHFFSCHLPAPAAP